MIEALDRAMTAARQAGRDALREAFVTRAIAAVAVLASGPDDVVGDAVAAPTDVEALYRILVQPEALAILQGTEPLAEARLRGLLAREEILGAEGGAVAVDDAARILGIARQAVERRRRNNRLIGLSLGRRGYRYPVWQFEAHGVLPGLDRVVARLAPLGPWFIASWLLSENSRLGVRPLDVLRAGRIEDVLAAAAAYGEQGA